MSLESSLAARRAAQSNIQTGVQSTAPDPSPAQPESLETSPGLEKESAIYDKEYPANSYKISGPFVRVLMQDGTWLNADHVGVVSAQTSEQVLACEDYVKRGVLEPLTKTE